MGSLILLYQAGEGCISGMYSKDKSAHDYDVYIRTDRMKNTG
jgi:hypothetical protein